MYLKTGMVDLLYIFKVRSDSIMFVPGGTNFCGKTLQEAPVSICIRTLSPAISIVAKILFSGNLSSFTTCTLPSVESKVTDNNSSSEEESASIMLTPLRGRLFLPGALLHISAK